MGAEYGHAFAAIYPALAKRYDVPYPFFLDDPTASCTCPTSSTRPTSSSASCPTDKLLDGVPAATRCRRIHKRDRAASLGDGSDCWRRLRVRLADAVAILEHRPGVGANACGARGRRESRRGMALAIFGRADRRRPAPAPISPGEVRCWSAAPAHLGSPPGQAIHQGAAAHAVAGMQAPPSMGTAECSATPKAPFAAPSPRLSALPLAERYDVRDLPLHTDLGPMNAVEGFFSTRPVTFLGVGEPPSTHRRANQSPTWTKPAAAILDAAASLHLRSESARVFNIRYFQIAFRLLKSVAVHWPA